MEGLQVHFLVCVTEKGGGHPNVSHSEGLGSAALSLSCYGLRGCACPSPAQPQSRSPARHLSPPYSVSLQPPFPTPLLARPLFPYQPRPSLHPLGPFSHSPVPPSSRYLERHVAQFALPPDLLHDAVAATRQLGHGEVYQILQLLRAVLHHLPRPPRLRRPGRPARNSPGRGAARRGARGRQLRRAAGIRRACAATVARGGSAPEALLPRFLVQDQPPSPRCPDLGLAPASVFLKSSVPSPSFQICPDFTRLSKEDHALHFRHHPKTSGTSGSRPLPWRLCTQPGSRAIRFSGRGSCSGRALGGQLPPER